ncbi:MAG TPA: hypothetical protein VF916_04030 [Ktedonobacterales bacterium]
MDTSPNSHDPQVAGRGAHDAMGDQRQRQTLSKLRSAMAFQSKLFQEWVTITVARDEAVLLGRYVTALYHAWYEVARLVPGTAVERATQRELELVRDLLQEAVRAADSEGSEVMCQLARVTLGDLIAWLALHHVSAWVDEGNGTEGEIATLTALRVALQQRFLQGSPRPREEPIHPLAEQLASAQGAQFEALLGEMDELSRAQELTVEAARQQAREVVLQYHRLA